MFVPILKIIKSEKTGLYSSLSQSQTRLSWSAARTTVFALQSDILNCFPTARCVFIFIFRAVSLPATGYTDIVAFLLDLSQSVVAPARLTRSSFHAAFQLYHLALSGTSSTHLSVNVY